MKKSLVVSQPMSDILFHGPANFVALTVLQPIPHYLKTELPSQATTVAVTRMLQASMTKPLNESLNSSSKLTKSPVLEYQKSNWTKGG